MNFSLCHSPLYTLPFGFISQPYSLIFSAYQIAFIIRQDLNTITVFFQSFKRPSYLIPFYHSKLSRLLCDRHQENLKNFCFSNSSATFAFDIFPCFSYSSWVNRQAISLLQITCLRSRFLFVRVIISQILFLLVRRNSLLGITMTSGLLSDLPESLEKLNVHVRGSWSLANWRASEDSNYATFQLLFIGCIQHIRCLYWLHLVVYQLCLMDLV